MVIQVDFSYVATLIATLLQHCCNTGAEQVLVSVFLVSEDLFKPQLQESSRELHFLCIQNRFLTGRRLQEPGFGSYAKTILEGIVFMELLQLYIALEGVYI